MSFFDWLFGSSLSVEGRERKLRVEAERLERLAAAEERAAELRKRILEAEKRYVKASDKRPRKTWQYVLVGIMLFFLVIIIITC